MAHRSSLAAGALAASLLASGSVQADVSPPLPELEILPQEGGYRIEAGVLGTTSEEVEATLSIQRQDASGNVSTSQSQRVSLTAGEHVPVASTTLSVLYPGRVEILLQISRGDEQVAEDRVVLGGG